MVVWIYGGGYVSGSKSSYNPAGLIAQSQKNGSDGFIFLALNYRLGMFGWLAGPTFQKNGIANAGLYDQRLALEWVQTYIHLFGGDPKRVTVMGESAGGGSIIHQLTAFGDRNIKAPFHQAIPQSPAWEPITSNAQEEEAFNKVLQYVSSTVGYKITSLSQLRTIPSSTLQTVNSLVIAQSIYGTFTFGPAVDGLFVPALPGELLLHGQFDSSVDLLIGHNANEALLFTPPSVTNNSAFHTYLTTILPSVSDAALDYIENVLYPPIFNGSFEYTSPFARLSLLIAESTFTCNTRYLDLAYDNRTYSYDFTIPPALHGQDIAYTFFNGEPRINATIAVMFQSYITNFVETGNPNGDCVNGRLPFFPRYGENSTTLSIDALGDGKIQRDELASGRCEWWQKALYA